MNSKWMLFFREVDHAHFFFNGEWPIAVRPMDETFGKFTPDDSFDRQVANTEPHVPLMKEVLENPRKRQFVINKQRYMVLQRGNFVNE